MTGPDGDADVGEHATAAVTGHDDKEEVGYDNDYDYDDDDEDQRQRRVNMMVRVMVSMKTTPVRTSPKLISCIPNLA